MLPRRLLLLCAVLATSAAWRQLLRLRGVRASFRRSEEEDRHSSGSRDDVTSGSSSSSKEAVTPLRVVDLQRLKDLVQTGYRVQDLDVRGDCFCNLSSTALHPVVQALYDRGRAGSEPGNRKDGRKIAIAIEGGGMRGCVASGMVTALWHLGLQDSIDVVYGSSAGSLVGAYFISRQLPYFGTEIYYDLLTSAGQEFIDVQALLRACGLGLLDLRVDSLIRLFTDRMGKPVINLDYLLDTIVQRTKPLDWNTFWAKQESRNQTLKVIASGLLSKRSVAMSAEDGNFRNIQELANCMKASMLLPGVTGDTVRLKVPSMLCQYQNVIKIISLGRPVSRQYRANLVA